MILAVVLLATACLVPIAIYVIGSIRQMCQEGFSDIRFRQSVRRVVVGTALEGIARRIDLYLTGNRNVIYDKETDEIIRSVLSIDSNAVDVGAHKGLILESIVKYSTQGKHYAFEPIPALAEGLRTHFPTVNVYDLALSDHNGQERFNHVLTNPGYSGLKQRHYPYKERVEELVVKTACLDDVIPEFTKISFIKIDVEGAELQVFRGAQRILRNNRPVVVFEHEPGGALSYGTKPDQVFEFLKGCGLDVWLMQDWLKGNPPIPKHNFVEQFENKRHYCFVAGARWYDNHRPGPTSVRAKPTEEKRA